MVTVINDQFNVMDNIMVDDFRHDFGITLLNTTAKCKLLKLLLDIAQPEEQHDQELKLI